MQLRQTPLEEVFMAVVRQAETEHAKYTQETMQLVLENGETLQVRYQQTASQAL